MTITLLITIALMFVGWKFGRTDTRDYKQSWQYARQYAIRYRHQRDDLQRRLTVRVLEVRELQARNRQLRRQVFHRADVLEAIRLAAIAYRVDYGLLVRRAKCESGLSATAKNRHSSASGLLQFLYPSTWRTTPYADESVWSPYASALAGAWMEANHRGHEWVCSGR